MYQHLKHIASLYFQHNELTPLQIHAQFVRPYWFDHAGYLQFEVELLECQPFDAIAGTESLEFVVLCILKSTRSEFKLHHQEQLDVTLLRYMIATSEVLYNISSDMYATLLQFWPVDGVDSDGLTLLNYAAIRKHAYHCDTLLTEFNASIEVEDAKYNNCVGTASIWYHIRSQDNTSVMKVLHFDVNQLLKLSKAQYLLESAVTSDDVQRVGILINKYKLDLNQCKTCNNVSLLSSIKSIPMFNVLVKHGFQLTTKLLKKESHLIPSSSKMLLYMIRLGYNYTYLTPKDEPHLHKACKKYRKAFEDEMQQQLASKYQHVPSHLHQIVCSFVATI